MSRRVRAHAEPSEGAMTFATDDWNTIYEVPAEHVWMLLKDLEALSEWAVIEFHPTGIVGRALDKSHVSMGRSVVHEENSQRPVQTGDSEFAAARLPPGDDAGAVAGTATRQPAHEVLGVAPDAPENVVESAARARKAETHPDNDGDRDEFRRVVEAEEVMLDG